MDVINLENVAYITEKTNLKMKQSIVKENDILLNITGASIGRSAVYKYNFIANVNQHVCIIRLKSNELADFFQFQLSSYKGQHNIMLNQAGGGREGLNFEQIGNLFFSLPNNLEEIESISHMLILLSSTIALQQRQLDLYTKLKKGLLQKLFPNDGEKVPEIRFADFHDNWELRKSDEIFISISKKGYPELPVLSVTQDHGVVKRENLNIDIKYDKTTLRNYKLVSNGNFIISLRSFQGGFELSRVQGIVSPAYTVFGFKNSDEQNLEFWRSWFKTFKFIQSLKKITFGIRDGKSISFSEFKSLKNTFPIYIKEQEKIGNLLKKIDQTITLQQRELDKLKSIKQFLLQKLFI